jgi:hypothetical protein
MTLGMLCTIPDTDPISLDMYPSVSLTPASWGPRTLVSHATAGGPDLTWPEPHNLH